MAASSKLSILFSHQKWKKSHDYCPTNEIDSGRMTFSDLMTSYETVQSSSERRQVGMKKKISASLSNFRKRIRPVSEAFTQLKKKSNQKLTKSTENLASIFSPFPKKESSPKHSSSCDTSIDDFLDLNELKNEIDKVEKEDQALREMQTLYL